MLHLRLICPNEYEQVVEYLSLQLLLSHISSPVYVLFYSENLCAVEAWSTSKFSGLVRCQPTWPSFI